MIGNVYQDFIGSDILDYLSTSESGLGKIIQPNRESLIAAIGIIGLFSIIGTGYILAVSKKDNESDEDS
jgi:hypothetical protein